MENKYCTVTSKQNIDFDHYVKKNSCSIFIKENCFGRQKKGFDILLKFLLMLNNTYNDLTELLRLCVKDKEVLYERSV